MISTAVRRRTRRRRPAPSRTEAARTTAGSPTPPPRSCFARRSPEQLTPVLSVLSSSGILDARNVGQRFDNNCGSFNFPPTGPEFTITKTGGNDGGWADWGTWCDDRPPTVEPPEPSPWTQP